ncbi:MAG: SIS domain-containing protein [Actinomycetales bacterium]|nr:SIS domain-containing protein [Actinomycetales bacterium]
MNPELFLADLERTPESLAGLGARAREREPWAGVPVSPSASIVLLGMGSSHYANLVAAARLRARGIRAVAELASSDLLPEPPSGEGIVVAVSAGGGSTETLSALERYAGRLPTVALTNVAGSAVTQLADVTVHMEAGEEAGGVACRSFQHTLAMHLLLEDALLDQELAPGLLDRAATACADLLERRGEWLPPLAELALGPDGTHLVAPARRLSSAQQGALMLREGPRLMATGCETGDWSHVDVYLTKTTDYRMLLFTGSRWEPELLRWVAERGSRMGCVGPGVPGAEVVVDFRHSADDGVRLLAEVLVPSLLAADAWLKSAPTPPS